MSNQVSRPGARRYDLAGRPPFIILLGLLAGLLAAVWECSGEEEAVAPNTLCNQINTNTTSAILILAQTTCHHNATSLSRTGPTPDPHLTNHVVGLSVYFAVSGQIIIIIVRLSGRGT